MKNFISILIVDDDQIHNFITAKVISSYTKNCRIKVALNGQEALKILKNDPDFDIIFLDINMPVMDGFDFLKNLGKSSIVLKDDTKLVILSSTSQPKEILKFSQFRIDGFIDKPITAQNIKEVVAVAV